MIEPAAKSMVAGRRLARLAARTEGPQRIVAVANKVREEGDAQTIEDRRGIEEGQSRMLPR